MKNNNVILKTLIVFVLMMSIFNINIYAQNVQTEEGMLDVELSDGVYKFSENKDIYLPFIRFATDRILIDKKLDGLGTSFSAQSIEVNSDIEGLQVLFATDSIRVNNKMEYGILFAGTNVTISSQIDKSLIVFASEKLTITEDAVIKGDIICFGTDIEINGTVEGSVIGTANNVTVNGNINKDLRIQVENANIKEDIVKGNIYVETYNKTLTLPESYKNTKINVLEIEQQEKSFDFSMIYMAIITAGVFTLMYFIVNKVSKNKLIDNTINKIKSRPIVAVLGGALSLMAIPAVFIILIMLSVLGLYMIAIPVLIIYLSFILVVGLLSTFIVGSVISEYMSKTKYLIEKGSKMKYLFAFVMYVVLYVFARLPYLGGYVTMLLLILAIGIAICSIFCKIKVENTNNNIEIE